MPDAYDIHDAQFLQQRQYISGVASLSIDTGAGSIPPGKCWTILAASGNPSVVETQIFFFSIYNDNSTMNYPVTTPVSIALGPTYPLPLVREGMELKLFPNERLTFQRIAATAGSTITLWIRYIETDIQYYVELDKHKVFRRRSSAMEMTGRPIYRSVAGTVIGGGGGGEVPGGGGGGGGEPVL